MNLFRYLAIMRRQSLFRLLLSVMITAITLSVFTSRALGVVVETDFVGWNGGVADFGNGFHFLGSPTGSGVVTFDYDQSSGHLIATGRVRGTLYWDSSSAGCARFSAVFKDSVGQVLATRNVDLCGPGSDANNSLNQKSVNVSFSSPNLFQVRISTAQLVNGAVVAATRVHEDLFTPNNRAYDASFSLIGFCFLVPCETVQLTRIDPFSHDPGPVDLDFERDPGAANSQPPQPGSMSVFFEGDVIGDNSAGRLITDFQTINGARLDRRTDNVGLHRGLHIIAGFDLSDSLWQVKLTLQSLSSGVVTGQTSKTFSFTGSTGNFTLDPSAASVAVHERFNYAFIWTVPEPGTWHDLQSLQLRIRDGKDTILWMRWEETTNTISLFNEASGKFGPGFKPGSPNVLQSAQATLNLAETTVKAVDSVLGTGPTSPSVQLNLGLSFKPSSAGRTFVVEVAASDHRGHEEPFAKAGTLTVTQ
jgi:hypothetical protein